jgi:hypothetical protein
MDIIVKSLAKIAGYTKFKRISLLSSQEGFATLILKTGRIMNTPTYAFSILRKLCQKKILLGSRECLSLQMELVSYLMCQMITWIYF